MDSIDTNSDLLVRALAEALRPAVVEAVTAVAREALAEQVRPRAEPLLSVAEAATLASVHPESIRRAIKSGRLPAVTSLGRHPRIRPADLERFLAPGTPTRRHGRKSR